MSLRSYHTTDDDRWPPEDDQPLVRKSWLSSSGGWPIGQDAGIAARLSQPGFRVLATLAGAGAGLYVMLTGGQGVVFFGPFIGVCTVYELWALIVCSARNVGARHAEIVRKE